MVTRLTDLEFAAFQALIHETTGIQMEADKRELLASRLVRRMEALGVADYREYYELLTASDPRGEEREQFVNSVTTNQTSFFREPHHFEFVRDQLIRELRARVAAGAPRRLRVWCGACSSGEEPYTLAMVAHRELARDGFAIEVHASDIDTEMLARARAARYVDAQMAGVSAELRTRYFDRVGDLWQVKDHLRALVSFHRINLLGDAIPLHGTFDAIFLRNVITYFDRADQVRLFARIAGYLADTSYLFIGHSESLREIDAGLALASQTVYRRGAPAGRDRRRS